MVGIYYTPGSLKAKLCVEGLEATYKYCDEHKIPYKKVGKVCQINKYIYISKYITIWRLVFKSINIIIFKYSLSLLLTKNKQIDWMNFMKED